MEQVQYITESEVAALTRMAVSSLRNNRYLRRGIPYSKIGRSVRYKLADVVDFMERHTVSVGE
jgi:hypothetical protein